MFVGATQDFGTLGTMESICNSDLKPALKAIGEDWGDKTKHRCFGDRLADVHPQDPGLQADCVVLEIAAAAGGTGTVTTLLPVCAAEVPLPCWKVVTHDEGKLLCEEGSGSIEIERNKPPAPGAKLDVRCASEVTSEAN